MDVTATASRSSGRGAHMVGAPSRDGQFASSIVGAHDVWIPNAVKSVHKDASMVQHQVVLTLMPGGVGHKASDDIELHLEKYGDDTYLAIGINWPDWVAKGTFLPDLESALEAEAEKEWATMEEDEKAEAQGRFKENFVLMSHSIKEQLAFMRPNPGVPALKATARIKLDFPVRPLTDKDWHFVGNATGVRMLFTDLKAPKTCSFEKSKAKAVRITKAKTD